VGKSARETFGVSLKRVDWRRELGRANPRPQHGNELNVTTLRRVGRLKCVSIGHHFICLTHHQSFNSLRTSKARDISPIIAITLQPPNAEIHNFERTPLEMPVAFPRLSSSSNLNIFIAHG
jgi:hypothetical protein